MLVSASSAALGLGSRDTQGMGLITHFLHRPDSQPNFRTEVECGWNTAHVDGRTLLRLETYGFTERQVPGKRSQSLELDERAAGELLTILRKAFPNLR
jgi:hypothetical protein